MSASSPARPRGEGGLAPAILVAENGNGEYAFLDLSTNAFDLSDRGVKGRDAPGPLDGYVYTERGVYRPGEEVNVTALVRDCRRRCRNAARHHDRPASRRRRVRPLHHGR